MLVFFLEPIPHQSRMLKELFNPHTLYPVAEVVRWAIAQEQEHLLLSWGTQPLFGVALQTSRRMAN